MSAESLRREPGAFDEPNGAASEVEQDVDLRPHDRRVVLELRGVSKRYGAITALDSVDFVARAGEAVGLVGDNGAGKSTMVKVIAGTITPDSGHVLVDGVEHRWESPHAALEAGIETVFQDGGLAPDLNVASNLFLGREVVRKGVLGRMGFLDQRRMAGQASEALAQIGMTRVAPAASLGRLSGGQRQAVAVARAAVWGRKILILDEPTNHLGVTEVAEVLRLVREVRDRGISVIFISHTLPYVLDVCDRVVTLRLGRVVAEYLAADVTTDRLVSDMTGSSAGIL